MRSKEEIQLRDREQEKGQSWNSRVKDRGDTSRQSRETNNHRAKRKERPSKHQDLWRSEFLTGET